MGRLPSGAIGGYRPTADQVDSAMSGVTSVADVTDALIAAGLVRETVPNGTLTINGDPLTIGGAYLTIGV